MARQKNPGCGEISFKKRAGYYEAGVWIDTPTGKKFHRIGRKGDPDLQRKYVLFCQEYYSTSVQPGETVYISTLFRQYLEKRLPRLHTADQHHVKTVMGLVAEKYGLTKVEDFDSVAYRCAQVLVAQHGERQKRPWSFAYCNKLMKYLRAVFRWGVGRKLFISANLMEIEAVEPIGQGDEQYDLGETTPRADVPDWVLKKTLPYLTPMLADMVKLIRGACLRPCELCRMRVQDLMESERGVVEIHGHKTARFGIRRFAAFTPSEMAILRRRSVGKGADEHIFSPRDAVQEAWDSYKKSCRTEDLARYPEEYTTHALGCLLRRCLDRARAAGERFPYWTLYQLRHASVTENSRLFGVETASYIAGHKCIKTTAIYDHKALSLAIMAAEERAKREESQDW